MHADERTRTIVHHEWTLTTPAHHTEVAKALQVAGQKHDAEPGYPSDIVFTHGDDEIVIGYSVEPPAPKPYATTPAAEWDRMAKTLREERDALAERLSLAYQALAADGYFGPYPLGDDLASRITELVVHLRGRAESAEAAVVRARELAMAWGVEGRVQARDDLVRALGDEEPGR